MFVRLVAEAGQLCQIMITNAVDWIYFEFSRRFNKRFTKDDGFVVIYDAVGIIVCVTG